MPRQAAKFTRAARIVSISIGVLVAALPAADLFSSRATAQSPDAIRKAVADKARILEETRRREAGLKRDVELLEGERARINKNLIDTAKAIQRSEGKLSEIEARLGELEAQEKIVRGSLAQSEVKVTKLLGAMQRMGRNPPPVMVTSRDDALKMVRSAMLLAAVFPELREQALLLTGKLNDMARVMADIRQEGDRLKAETQRLVDARTTLDALLADKRDNISERSGELKQVRQAAAELSRSMTDLNELIARMDMTVKEQPSVAAYERELAAIKANEKPEEVAAANSVAAAQAPRAPSPATSDAPVKQAAKSDPAKLPAETVEAPAIELKPKAGDRLALALPPPNPGRLKPAFPFEKAKGLLRMPAVGRRVASFGDKTEVGNTSKGIVIETRAGAQITSPSDGWVVYAGEFRSYGQLLIISAGGGYHVVLAGLTRIDAGVGQLVLAGEPVGRMGTGAPQAVVGSPAGVTPKTADTPSVLYIEFRKDGRPIDPDPWWAADGAQKVQG